MFLCLVNTSNELFECYAITVLLHKYDKMTKI